MGKQGSSCDQKVGCRSDMKRTHPCDDYDTGRLQTCAFKVLSAGSHVAEATKALSSKVPGVTAALTKLQQYLDQQAASEDAAQHTVVTLGQPVIVDSLTELRQRVGANPGPWVRGTGVLRDAAMVHRAAGGCTGQLHASAGCLQLYQSHSMAMRLARQTSGEHCCSIPPCRA
jgi:hypothetical protein